MQSLNPEQQRAFDLITKSRKNVFLTGSGGTGKTTIIKQVYAELSLKYNVGLTSLTGISAMVVGGRTLHSFLGIGLGNESCKKLAAKLSKNTRINSRWRRLDVLIVDEISMLSVELFEKLEHLACILRENEAPFGGIQLLFSGDFLQLPAVKMEHFCFESPQWTRCIEEVVVLRQIMRQKDEAFMRVLNKIRMGEPDEECKELIGSREIKYFSDIGLIPTMLYATNAKVDATNQKYYGQLTGEEFIYKIKISWYQRIKNQEIYESRVKFPAELKLKIGAQVMQLINDPDGLLVNGSRGVVVEFIDGFPKVAFSCGLTRIVKPCCLDLEEDDKKILSYSQIPLRLAWSATCHKLQGCTVSLIRIDFKQFFEYGQFYTALSRCESLDGIYIRNLDWNRCLTHPRALQFYKTQDQAQA